MHQKHASNGLESNDFGDFDFSDLSEFDITNDFDISNIGNDWMPFHHIRTDRAEVTVGGEEGMYQDAQEIVTMSNAEAVTLEPFVSLCGPQPTMVFSADWCAKLVQTNHYVSTPTPGTSQGTVMYQATGTSSDIGQYGDDSILSGSSHATSAGYAHGVVELSPAEVNNFVAYLTMQGLLSRVSGVHSKPVLWVICTYMYRIVFAEVESAPSVLIDT